MKCYIFSVFANHIASTAIRMQVKDYHDSLVPFVAISLRCCLYSQMLLVPARVP